MSTADSYSLPTPSPGSCWRPLAAVGLALVVVLGFFASAMSVKDRRPRFNLDALQQAAGLRRGADDAAGLAGPQQPQDHPRPQTFEVPVEGQPDKTQTMPAIQWLLDLLGRPEVAADYKVFRVDNQDVKGMLGLKDDEKFFSWNELFRDTDNRGQAPEAVRAGRPDVAEKDQDAYQAKVMELYHHATMLPAAGARRRLRPAVRPARATRTRPRTFVDTGPSRWRTLDPKQLTARPAAKRWTGTTA